MGSEVQPRFVPAQGSDPAGGRWQSEAGFLGLRYLWVRDGTGPGPSPKARGPNPFFGQPDWPEARRQARIRAKKC